ncbi:MAG: hypothetical protein KC543_17040 [Myxococcales bacterium]|nr:hypothetical protein [Myxococcales bacterium]
MLRCALCTLLIAAAGLGVGCTNANPSLFVLNNAKPDEMCKISGDLGGDSDVQLTRGRWDVQPTGARYVLNLRVANNSMQNANEVRSNTNDVHMLSAEVEALNPDGVPIPFQNAPGVMHPESVPNPFVVPLAGGTVAASKDGVTPGVGFARFPAIPNAYRVAVQQFLNGQLANNRLPEVVLSIRLKGKTTGGHTLTTDSFLWPVTLCNGCEVCRGIPDATQCEPGQDGYCYTLP